MAPDIPLISSNAILVKSEELDSSAKVVKGYTFEDEVVNYDDLFKCYSSTGFQATHLGQAIGIVNNMVRASSFCWKFKNQEITNKLTHSTMYRLTGDHLQRKFVMIWTKMRAAKFLWVIHRTWYHLVYGKQFDFL